ncbi:hypothetical protein [Novipirellula rosea]|uniref:Uncharacterized protein n=1 Tax=Novipirellula rosea TaxID=1031540 RepID=A0ABP8N476_9BACT
MTNLTIEYRGQHVRMSQPFGDYEEYTDAMDLIAEEEYERVTAAVRRAAVPSSVASIEEMSRAIGDVEFPGFQTYSTSRLPNKKLATIGPTAEPMSFPATK